MFLFLFFLCNVDVNVAFSSCLESYVSRKVEANTFPNSQFLMFFFCFLFFLFFCITNNATNTNTTNTNTTTNSTTTNTTANSNSDLPPHLVSSRPVFTRSCNRKR